MKGIFLACFIFVIFDTCQAGKLITVSGIDGAGKTTLVENIKTYLVENGHSVIVYQPLSARQEDRVLIETIFSASKYYSDERLSKEMRESYFVSYYSFLFAHRVFNEIIPSLMKYDYVICDRYLESHIASQQAFGNDLSSFDPIFHHFPEANYAILLDIPTDLAWDRIRKRGKPLSPLETKPVLERTRQILLDMAQVNKKMRVLEAAQSKQYLLEQALSLVFLGIK